MPTIEALLSSPLLLLTMTANLALLCCQRSMTTPKFFTLAEASHAARCSAALTKNLPRRYPDNSAPALLPFTVFDARR